MVTYVQSKNHTGKLHLPDCPAAKRLTGQQAADRIELRIEPRDLGYRLCGHCRLRAGIRGAWGK